MNFTPLSIPDVVLVTPDVFGDDRGFFMETYRADQFVAAGIQARFVQDNHSGSQQGVLRGLHYQIKQPQGKLIRALAGEIFDVAVDIRVSSPTFGQWVGYVLSAINKQQLWVPEGFAHGFYVMSEWAEVAYKATNYYAPLYERSILWDDPQLGIDWPIIPGTKPVLSSKDLAGESFTEAEYFD